MGLRNQDAVCPLCPSLLQAYTTYFIVVDGYSGAAGEYTLSVDCNPRCPGKPGTVDSMSPPVSQYVALGVGGGAVSPSPSQSTMLIQALLHLSRTPSPSPALSAVAAAPPPVVPAHPSPVPATSSPRNNPAGASQLHTPPIGSAVSTSNNARATSRGGGATTNDRQPLPPAPIMQGPLGALLSAAGSDNAVPQVPPEVPPIPPSAAPDAGKGAGAYDPLTLIKASSLEDTPSSPAVNASIAQNDTSENRSEHSRGLAAPIPHASQGQAMPPHVTEDMAVLVGADAGSQVGSTTGQHIQLVDDLGVNSIALGRPTADEKEPQETQDSHEPPVTFSSGLSHGAGGFTASTSVDAVQGNRFGGSVPLLPEDIGPQPPHATDKDKAESTEGKQATAELQGAVASKQVTATSQDTAATFGSAKVTTSTSQSQRLGEKKAANAASNDGNDHVSVTEGRSDEPQVTDAFGWERAAADLAALSTQSEQQLPVDLTYEREG